MTDTALLKARPTTYNGIEMRSRLEARVAAFLDSLSLEWEYEPRAFAKGRRQYLPDFRLRGRGRSMYLEVKGLVDDLDGLLDVRGRMEIILASEPAAVLVWADADGLEAGLIEWRHPVIGHWKDVLIPELLLEVGVGLCGHYRMPEWDA